MRSVQNHAFSASLWVRSQEVHFENRKQDSVPAGALTINMARAAACKYSMGCHVSFVSMVEVRAEQPQDVSIVLPTSRALLRLPKLKAGADNPTSDTTTQAFQPASN